MHPQTQIKQLSLLLDPSRYRPLHGHNTCCLDCLHAIAVSCADLRVLRECNATVS